MPHLLLRGLDLLPEGAGGHPQRPGPQNDELLCGVGGDHPGAVVLGDAVGGLLDVHVGGLRLLGVHHVQVVVAFHRAHAPLHLVGVEHQNGHALAVGGVVAQDVHQLPPGGLQALGGQVPQVIPGEDHVVAVHQQVLGPLLGGLYPVGGLGLFRR